MCVMLFRKARSGRQDVALFVREQLEYMELCLEVNSKWIKSLWVKTKGQTNKSDTVVATGHLNRRKYMRTFTRPECLLCFSFHCNN